MGAEVEADGLGDEWKGYVFRIAGGNDKQGFPMKQGILTTGTLFDSCLFSYLCPLSHYKHRLNAVFGSIKVW